MKRETSIEPLFGKLNEICCGAGYQIFVEFELADTPQVLIDASGADGLAVQEIIEAAILSWDENRVVDIENGKFITAARVECQFLKTVVDDETPTCSHDFAPFQVKPRIGVVTPGEVPNHSILELNVELCIAPAHSLAVLGGCGRTSVEEGVYFDCFATEESQHV